MSEAAGVCPVGKPPRSLDGTRIVMECNNRDLQLAPSHRGFGRLWFLVCCLMGLWLLFAQASFANEPDGSAGTGTGIDRGVEVPGIGSDALEAEPRYETATVVTVRTIDSNEREVVVLVTSGAQKGQEVKILQALTGQAGMDLAIEPGDGVMIAAVPSEDGRGTEYQLADWQRRQPLVLLGVALGAATVALGGLRGIKTLVVLALTAAGIVFGLIPLTLEGVHPLLVSILLAALVASVTTLLTSGWEKKSFAATLGTLASVLTTALIASLVVDYAHLNGVETDDPQMVFGQGVNLPGFLAASMVLGSLGIVLDLALSIAAAVCEVAESNPKASPRTLLQTGWQVGQDLLSTAGNTLLMAYIGCFLPVMLALGAQSTNLARLFHTEVVANAVGALLVGLIGLVITIPYTTWIVVALNTGKHKRQSTSF